MGASPKLDFPVLCYFGSASVRRYETAVELFEVWPSNALLQSLRQEGWTLVDSSGVVCFFKDAALSLPRNFLLRLAGIKMLSPCDPLERLGDLSEEKRRLVDAIHSEFGSDLDFEDSVLAGYVRSLHSVTTFSQLVSSFPLRVP